MINTKKILIALTAFILMIGAAVHASDLIIESNTQTFNEGDSKIKFKGDVKVSVDDLRVEGQTADVDVKGEKLDTATFYDKPYAYEVKKNKKREVKANILKLSLITFSQASLALSNFLSERYSPVFLNISAEIPESF